MRFLDSDLTCIRDLKALVVRVFQKSVGLGGKLSGMTLGLRVKGKPRPYRVVLLVHGNFAALLHDIMEDAKVFCSMLVVTMARTAAS